MSKESKFCHSNILYFGNNYCGDTTIECDQGYVINVVEVEKGDYSTCLLGCICCDETSWNQEWTVLMKRHCDGKRTCDTSTVRDEKERAVKTVYNCTQELPSTFSTSTIELNTKASTPHAETTQPHDPTRHLNLSTSEPGETSNFTTPSYTEQSSPTNIFRSAQSHLKIPSEDNMFPLVTTVAVSTVTIVAIVMLIIIVLMCRKRRLNMQKKNSLSSTTRPRSENADVAGNEGSVPLQPMEDSQYENSGFNARHDTSTRDDDCFISGQFEKNQYDHVGIVCQNRQQKTENVYNVANYNGADQGDDSVYNNSNFNDKEFGNDNEYDIANNETQNCDRLDEYSIANHKGNLSGNDKLNDYNIAVMDTQDPISENEYSYANELTSFNETIEILDQPEHEEENVELDHEYHILSPPEPQNPNIDNVYELV